MSNAKYVGPTVPAGAPDLNRQLQGLDQQAAQLTQSGQSAQVVQVPDQDAFRIRLQDQQ